MLFSEPKIPQLETSRIRAAFGSRFSALQRAENSSMRARGTGVGMMRQFQCSSASRKFLNRAGICQW